MGDTSPLPWASLPAVPTGTLPDRDQRDPPLRTAQVKADCESVLRAPVERPLPPRPPDNDQAGDQQGSRPASALAGAIRAPDATPGATATRRNRQSPAGGWTPARCSLRRRAGAQGESAPSRLKGTANGSLRAASRSCGSSARPGAARAGSWVTAGSSSSRTRMRAPGKRVRESGRGVRKRTERAHRPGSSPALASRLRSEGLAQIHR